MRHYVKGDFSPGLPLSFSLALWELDTFPLLYLVQIEY